MLHLPYERDPLYRRTMALATRVYACTASFPAEEKAGLGGGLRRAAASHAATVAQALGSQTASDLERSAGAALSGVREMLTQLDLSVRLKVAPRRGARSLRKALLLQHERIQIWREQRLSQLQTPAGDKCAAEFMRLAS